MVLPISRRRTRVRFMCEKTLVGWLEIWTNTEMIQFNTDEGLCYERVWLLVVSATSTVCAKGRDVINAS